MISISQPYVLGGRGTTAEEGAELSIPSQELGQIHGQFIAFSKEHEFQQFVLQIRSAGCWDTLIKLLPDRLDQERVFVEAYEGSQTTVEGVLSIAERVQALCRAKTVKAVVPLFDPINLAG